MTTRSAEPLGFQFATKAQTLEKLASQLRLFHVPSLLYFTAAQWGLQREHLLDRIRDQFADRLLIVRSSAHGEDGATSGFAGQYESVMHVDALDRDATSAAIERVVASYTRKGGQRDDTLDEVILQEMVVRPLMSGVLFTRDLNSGAPYYAINYDDVSGRTDTVTSGGSEYANRTLYVHRGAVDKVRSSRFRALLKAVAELEALIGPHQLDIEFAVDASLRPHLLQVRPITTQMRWDKTIEQSVDGAIQGISRLLHGRLEPSLTDRPSVFGQMPDWNPAEMIGRAPRRLASSLYRHLVTDRAWRSARAEMGYHEPIGQPLMVLLAGQPYIDVRASFSSFLPADLPGGICAKLVDAWLGRLRNNHHLHDKIEFEVAITSYIFDLDERLSDLMPEVLSSGEAEVFRGCLRRLTASLVLGQRASIPATLEMLERLEYRNRQRQPTLRHAPSDVAAALEECIRWGTVPFAILARHAFIAKSFLLSLVRRGVISQADELAFSGSIHTVARDVVTDLRRLARSELRWDDFMERYGHLRPGTYDILSPRYDQLPDILAGVQGDDLVHDTQGAFEFSPRQKAAIDSLLKEAGFDGLSHADFVSYLRSAIAGREWGKFVFTRTLSDVLEMVAHLGFANGASREQMSHLYIEDILKLGVVSDSVQIADRINLLADEGATYHATTVATRLPQLITDENSIHVVPFQVSHPNFITHLSVIGPCVRLGGEQPIQSVSLEGKIVLIENADPGFDWIFAHKIKGLVTKFGGANSHMAIRCAEFSIPAAIGCGEQIFERIDQVSGVEIKCGERHIRPVRLL